MPRVNEGIQKARVAIQSLARRLRAAGWTRMQALYTALGLYLTVGLVVSALLLWGFAELTDAVLEGETLAFDRAVLNWLATHRTDWRTRIAIEVTALGSMVVVTVTGMAMTVVLLHLKRVRHVLLIWASLIGSILINAALKDVFGRDRPDFVEQLVTVGFQSFPSGHAMNSMVFYTVLAYVVGHLTGPGTLRRTTYLVGAVLVIAVGLTRLYLGVHFPSDVIGGYVVGYAWAMMCAVLAEAWGRGLLRNAPRT